MVRIIHDLGVILMHGDRLEKIQLINGVVQTAAERDFAMT